MSQAPPPQKLKLLGMARVVVRQATSDALFPTYAGSRGTYKLINEVWKWLHNDLGLEDEAKKVALSFVLPRGEYAWETD